MFRKISQCHKYPLIDFIAYREIVFIDFSDVEVPDWSKVHVSHVVAFDVADLMPKLMDLSSEIILSLLLYISKLVPCIKIVLYVFELNFAS